MKLHIFNYIALFIHFYNLKLTELLDSLNSALCLALSLKPRPAFTFLHCQKK